MPIIIDLGVVDKDAAKKIENVAKSLEKLDSSLGGAADQMERLNKAGGRAGPTMRRSARGGPGAPPRIRFTKGPAQRLLDLQQQQSLLGGITDPTQRAAVAQDIQRSKFLAQRQLTLQQRRNADPQALQRPGLLELFEGLNKKIGGLGGGAGRGAGAMARLTRMIAKLPGPLKILAIALAVLTAKIIALGAIFKAVLSQGKLFGRGAAVTGGNLSAFESLIGVAKFLGTDPTTLANTIGGGGGGLKGAAIQGLGGSALPNFARPGLSNAENTRRIIDTITDPTRSNASIRRLTQMGGPEFERLQELRNLTPGQARRLQASAAGTVTPEQIKATAEFRAELVILGNAFEKLKTSVAVVTAIKFVTFHLELLAKVLDFIGRVIRNIVNSIPGFNIGGGKSISEMAEDRMRENTKALRENSQRLSQNTETLGGGRRAQRALPPGAINDIIFNNGAPGAVGLGLL